MAERDFRTLLAGKWDEGKFLCIGLDPDKDKLPASVAGATLGERLLNFTRPVIDATKDIVCAYKPNSAFFEAHGDGRFTALKETITYIHEVAPDVPVVLDAKRADIGNTNRGYVESVFGFLGADAVTVHPYLGGEALQPFLSQKNKGIFVLCRTSNEGAREFQDLKVVDPAAAPEAGGEELYKVVARHVARTWNENANCGLVVGATYPDELRAVRGIAADMPILIPGVGAQNGELIKAVQAGKDGRGHGFLLSSSRAVIFASSGEDFAAAARAAAQKLHGDVSAALLQ